MKAQVWVVCGLGLTSHNGQVFLGLTDLTIVQNSHVNCVNPHSQNSPWALHFPKSWLSSFSYDTCQVSQEKSCNRFYVVLRLKTKGVWAVCE
jgi:hypothetical protein